MFIQISRLRPSRKTVFALLMLLSVCSLGLPAGWSNGLKHVVQLVVPGQDMMNRGALRAGALLDGEAMTREIDALRRERDALGHALTAQRGLVDQIGAENRRLKLLRSTVLPPPTPLLPARVTGRDVLAWRDAALLDRGSSKGVSMRDWVASRLFVDQGGVQSVQPGAPVTATAVELGREVLIGRIEQVSPYVSRVQMFTDVDSRPIEVRVRGRATRAADAAPNGGDPGPGGMAEEVPYPCSLRGLGQGRMVIRDVPVGHVQLPNSPESLEGGRRIAMGDYVVSAPKQFGLPTPMVIGRVASLEPNPTQRLMADVIVEPVVRPEEVHDVVIVPLIPGGSSAAE